MKKLDAKEKAFMMMLIDNFKAFVSDSMDDGMHNHFPDHLEFLAACMETFIDKESEV
jgi:hypothetical protein